jgi:hypothetical protein
MKKEATSVLSEAEKATGLLSSERARALQLANIARVLSIAGLPKEGASTLQHAQKLAQQIPDEDRQGILETIAMAQAEAG